MNKALTAEKDNRYYVLIPHSILAYWDSNDAKYGITICGEELCRSWGYGTDSDYIRSSALETFAEAKEIANFVNACTQAPNLGFPEGFNLIDD